MSVPSTATQGSDEPPRSLETAETVEHSLGVESEVAASTIVPLLVAAGGDRRRALDIWRHHRAGIDGAVERLLDDQAGAGSTLLAAVGAALATGVGDVESLISHALESARDPISRADAHRALAKVGTWRGDTLRAAALAEWAAAEVSVHDGRREVELRLDVTTTLLHAGHLEAAEVAARRTIYAAKDHAELAAVADVLLTWILTARGTPVSSVPAMPKRSVLDALGATDVRVGVLFSRMLVWAGRHSEARELLGRTESRARATAPDTMPFVLAVVSDLEHRAGWWRTGSEAADEAITLAQQSGSRNVHALLLTIRARFDAARGDRERCLDRLRSADRIEHGGGLRLVGLHSASTRALLESGTGDHEAAAAHAERARRIGREMGLGHPGVDLFAGDLIEALVRTGSISEAHDAIDELEASAEGCDDDLGRAIAVRGRILLATDDEIGALAHEALALHDNARVPFERARTKLVIGERLRRTGRRRDARVSLLKAHSEFVRLGAQPWADRALVEMRAAGAKRRSDRSGETSRLDSLSPQEQQVARLVADGATNQEAATTMYLSPKSVERHLTAIYRKLGLRSRSQLTRWYDRQNGPDLVDESLPDHT